MNSLISKICSICVVVVFILSTSGFTIYSHHCSENGTSYSYSFIKTQDNCEQCNNKQPDNIKESCCSTTQNSELVNNTGNCCTSDGSYMKFIVEFIVPADFEPDLISNLDKVQTNLLDQVSDILIHANISIANYSLPPPKKGADIVILLNQQKTSPSPHA